MELYTSAREYYLTKCKTDDQRTVLNLMFDLCEKHHTEHLIIQDLHGVELKSERLSDVLNSLERLGCISDKTPFEHDCPYMFTVPY